MNLRPKKNTEHRLSACLSSREAGGLRLWDGGQAESLCSVYSIPSLTLGMTKGDP